VAISEVVCRERILSYEYRSPKWSCSTQVSETSAEFMICYIVAESTDSDARVALTPATAQELGKLGLELRGPPGLGRASHYADEDYRAAGVTFTDDAAGALAAADLVLRV